MWHDVCFEWVQTHSVQYVVFVYLVGVIARPTICPTIVRPTICPTILYLDYVLVDTIVYVIVPYI